VGSNGNEAQESNLVACKEPLLQKFHFG